jgi:hypothetical protein
MAARRRVRQSLLWKHISACLAQLPPDCLDPEEPVRPAAFTSITSRTSSIFLSNLRNSRGNLARGPRLFLELLSYIHRSEGHRQSESGAEKSRLYQFSQLLFLDLFLRPNQASTMLLAGKKSKSRHVESMFHTFAHR